MRREVRREAGRVKEHPGEPEVNNGIKEINKEVNGIVHVHGQVSRSVALSAKVRIHWNHVQVSQR